MGAGLGPDHRHRLRRNTGHPPRNDLRPHQYDRHVLRADKGTPMRMVCAFNLPLTGREVHDQSGAHSLSD